MREFELLDITLDLFAGNLNPNKTTDTTATTGNDLSVEMKTYYSDYLIDLAEAELVHDQFGQKHPIPKGGGKTIEFRQYDPLPEMTTPIVEAVTPDGQSLNVKNLTATISQYGGYVTLSDMLILTAIDNNLIQATKLIASQAGRTLDTITREVLNAGTVVQYSGGAQSRVGLTNATTYHLSVDDIKKAVRTLETQDAPKIDGYYVGIIHPYAKYDLMKDPQWEDPHKYVDTTNIYENEIGRLYGVRFVQASRAKKFTATPLTEGSATLTVRSNVSSSTTVPVNEKITAADATALAGKTVMAGTAEVTIASATAGNAGSASLTLSAAATISKDVVIHAGDAGADGADVYSTLILADDAYGVTEVTGGGLEHIVKQLGSAGTGDPLDQRATVGWKATKVAEILVQQYMVRIESTATP